MLHKGERIFTIFANKQQTILCLLSFEGIFIQLFTYDKKYSPLLDHAHGFGRGHFTVRMPNAKTRGNIRGNIPGDSCGEFRSAC